MTKLKLYLTINSAFSALSGVPFVTYRDNFNGGKISVVIPTSSRGYNNVGPLGFSTNPIRTQQIVFKDDIPYVVFRDANTDKVTVMKNDGGWFNVGSAGFSAGSILFPSLTFHEGRATVAYSDAVDNEAASVKYYNVAEWADKNSMSASDGKATDQQLLSSDGDLYLAFLDWANGEKITVRKFVDCDLDVSVSFAGNALTANAPDKSYQWFDCANFASIPGETNQVFTPSANGSYAVIVTDGVCSDTSMCTSITVGIKSIEGTKINLFPNPTNGHFSILSEERILGYTISNLAGLPVVIGNRNEVDLSDLASGIYLISIATENETIVKRIIKS